MRLGFWHYGLVVMALFFAISSFGLLIPTNNENVDLYLGLFGSTNNPALHTGCYSNTTDIFTGKQLIEYHYTAMDCVDSVNKLATPGMSASADPSESDDDLMRHVLNRASAFQLGLNFSFNS